MALLPDADRADLAADIMRDLSDARQSLGTMTKAQLRAAIDAADAWADANAASYNTALPLPARTVLTSQQKARLLKLVITQRFVRA
jgi:hypothetical protein